jgi:hypothetical protein
MTFDSRMKIDFSFPPTTADADAHNLVVRAFAFILAYRTALIESTAMRAHTSVSIILSLLLVCSASAFQSLQGVTVRSAQQTDSPFSSNTIDIYQWLCNDRCVLVFGTYAADFNAIEYAQRLRYYWPKMKAQGYNKCALLLNCQPKAALTLKEQTDLPNDIELWVDNLGTAGKVFGVGRGWLPENKDINPFLKLFGMLFGLGAWATLPAVIGGYIGNPFVPQPWIADALEVGQKKGRWPDTALRINSDGTVVNNFDGLPIVGRWSRRPLELATLRLQSMIGISLAKWQDLAPDQAALDMGVLTQLGGCIVVDNGKVVFDWRDPGICAVANFEDVMKKL